MADVDGRLDGGHDRGARLVGGTVRRPVRPWTPAVHDLLEHLHEAGFDGAPRPLGQVDGEEVLTYLPGRTVGTARPWPSWTHDDTTLDEVGDWLRRYHVAVADHVPRTGARWRAGGTWRPGQIVAHQDAAPYNAVWDDRLIGFVDWDMAGPADPPDDLAWVAFSWTPLHARAVVESEGFTDFAARRSRLERLARAYGWDGSVADLLDRVAGRLENELATLHRLAASGDPAYLRMLERATDRSAPRSGDFRPVRGVQTGRKSPDLGDRADAGQWRGGDERLGQWTNCCRTSSSSTSPGPSPGLTPA